MKSQWLIAAVAGACLTGAAIAQEPAQQQDQQQEPVYFPLFSEEMIRAASPEQAARMRETETRNRQAFDARQQSLRERREGANEDAAGQARQDPVPTRPRRRGKSKVFKWVDANGLVHFGDTPPSRGAQEVHVGGAARIEGTPPPAPGRARDTEESEDKL